MNLYLLTEKDIHAKKAIAKYYTYCLNMYSTFHLNISFKMK